MLKKEITAPAANALLYEKKIIFTLLLRIEEGQTMYVKTVWSILSLQS